MHELHDDTNRGVNGRYPRIEAIMNRQPILTARTRPEAPSLPTFVSSTTSATKATAGSLRPHSALTFRLNSTPASSPGGNHGLRLRGHFCRGKRSFGARYSPTQKPLGDTGSPPICSFLPQKGLVATRSTPRSPCTPRSFLELARRSHRSYHRLSPFDQGRLGTRSAPLQP